MVFENVSKLSLKQAKWDFPNNMTVLLDTNVLIYSKRPEIAEQIGDHLDDLLKSGKPKTLAISEVSLFEALTNCKPQEMETLEKIIDRYPAIPITKEVQIIAALLKNYYSENGVRVQGISLADLYIASTSALCVCPIVTANESDFPSCMFEEYGTRPLVWKERGRTKNIVMHLLIPDLSKFYELEKEGKKAKPAGRALIETILKIGPKANKTTQPS